MGLLPDQQSTNIQLDSLKQPLKPPEDVRAKQTRKQRTAKSKKKVSRPFAIAAVSVSLAARASTACKDTKSQE